MKPFSDTVAKVIVLAGAIAVLILWVKFKEANDPPAPSQPDSTEQTDNAPQGDGLSPEAIAKAEGALEQDLKDPEKVKLLECMGVKVYEDPQPPGHPPSAQECAEVQAENGMSPSDAPTAAAPPNDNVPFDRDAEIKGAQFDQLEAGAVSCMDQLLHGYLMQGMRSRAQLIQWATHICGVQLSKFMVETGKQTKELADSYVEVLANKELDLILRENGQE
ncbi:MAG TPA: hypothetical protein VMS78_15355 [Rhizomicrobium sp.]|nr:hypothetical protein [Rhizomicrobium sp.]